MHIPQEHYCALTAIGNFNSNIAKHFSKFIKDCDCNIICSRITPMGQEITIAMLIRGNWSAIAKLEATMATIEHDLDLIINTKRTLPPEEPCQGLSYTVQIIAVDKIGILNNVANFFSTQRINIEDIVINTIENNNCDMLNMSFQIKIPENIHLALIRERFMNFCDSLNVDAVMEPRI